MGIPLKDAIAMLDTDYASEAQTCGSDTDVSVSTMDRHTKAGLGQTAKKVVGFEWRSLVTYSKKITVCSSERLLGMKTQSEQQ